MSEYRASIEALRARSDRMLSERARSGLALSEADLARVYAFVGLQLPPPAVAPLRECPLATDLALSAE